MTTQKAFSRVLFVLGFALTALGANSTRAWAQTILLNTPAQDYVTYSAAPNGSVLTEAATATATGVVNSIDVKIVTNTGGSTETLTVTAPATFVVVPYDLNTRILSITDPDTNATPAEWNTALRAVTYNSGANPAGGTSRTITFTPDGAASANTTLYLDRNLNTTIDLNGPDPDAGTSYTSKIWVNGTVVDLGTVDAEDDDAYVSDSDSFGIESITVKLGDGNPLTLGDSPDGNFETIDTSTNSFGTVTVTRPNKHTLLLATNDGSPAALSSFNQIIRTIYYDNTSTFELPRANAPVSGNRTVTFSADGGAQVVTATATIPVEYVNDPPVVDLNGGAAGIDYVSTEDSVESFTISITSGGTVTEPEDQYIVRMRFNLDGRVDHGKTNDEDQDVKAIEKLNLYIGSPGFKSISSSDNITGDESGTITITYSYGPYNLINGGTRTFSYNWDATNGVLDISGNAESAYWQQILNSVEYSNSSPDPTETNRTVTVQAYDIEKGSIAAKATLPVAKENNSAYFDSGQSNVTFAGSATGAGHVGTLTFSITDVDDETADYDPGEIDPNVATDYNRLPASNALADRSRYIKITLGATHGILSLDNTEGSVANLYFEPGYGSDNSANMTFIGRQEDINNVLSGFKYTTDDSYSNSALITLYVNDLGNTTEGGVGGGPTTAYSTLVDVTSGGQSGAPKISLDGNAVINGDATQSTNWATTFVFGQGEISVADSDAFLYDIDDNINKVTISISDAANDGAAENLNLPLAIPGVDASDYTHTYDAVNKVLVINKTASGTEDDLERIIRAVTYNHAPGTVTGTGRTITFVVNDSVIPPNQGSAFTAIDFDNGGPDIDLNGGTAADGEDLTQQYDPSGGAVYVAPGALLTEPDNEVRSATVTLTNPDPANQGSEILLFSVTGSIQGNYDINTGVLTFTGKDTAANYQQVLRSVRYSNVSSTPTQLDRIITFTVSDGNTINDDTATATLYATAQPPASSATIDLNGADDLNGTFIPEDNGDDTSFEAQWGKVAGTHYDITDSDAFVLDNNDDLIQKITVTIADRDGADSIDGSRQDDIDEVINGATATANGITVGSSYDANSGVLTIQRSPAGQTAPEALFQNVLRKISYKNLKANGGTGTARQFRFDVYSDNTTDVTATAWATLSTTPPIVDQTSIDLDTGNPASTNYSTTWNTGTTTSIAPDSAVTETDGSVRRVVVTFAAPDGSGNEVLSFTAGAGISPVVSSSSGNVVLTLDGPATPAAFTSTLQSVTYQNNASTPSGTSRVFTFDVYGDDTSNVNASATSTITAAPGAGFNISKSQLTTSETGTTDSFTIKLTKQPASGKTVVLAVTSNNTAEGKILVDANTNTYGASRTLTFTTADWNTAQTVTVKGIDDGTVADGNIAYKILIETTNNALTDDPEYATLDPSDVDAVNQDNDSSNVNVIANPTSLTTSESGGTAYIDVNLSTAPTADVTVRIRSNNPAEGKVASRDTPTTFGDPADYVDITFPANTIPVPQRVAIVGQDDFERDFNVQYNILFTVTSNDPAYNGYLKNPLTVTNTDNETDAQYSLAISPTAKTVTEGEAGDVTDVTFNVTLSQAATQVVTVKVKTADGTATAADNDYDPAPAATTDIIFQPGETSQEFTTQVYGDGKLEGDETFSVNLFSPTGGATIATSKATVTITNDDQVKFSIDLDVNATGTSYQGAWNQTVGVQTAITAGTGNVTIVDESNSGTKISKMTVAILNRQDGASEKLSATSSASGKAVVQDYDPESSDGVLTIVGPATAADFQEVLQSVEYENEAADNSTGEIRTFRFDVFVGTTVVSAFSTITTPDYGNTTPQIPAVIDLNGPDNATDASSLGVNFVRNWNKGGKTKLSDGDSFVDKLNNTSIAKVTVEFYDDPDPDVNTGQQDSNDGSVEKLTATNAGAVTATYANSVLTLTGPGSEAEFTSAIRTVAYTNSLSEPTGTRRKFLFKVYANGDAGGATATAITSITIGLVSDDWDGDGIPNASDTDADGDGILDTVDLDINGDGIPDADSDSDGIPDASDTDDDNDGVPDTVDSDDDGDGVPDIYEGTATVLDLNGSSPGVNWTNQWIKTGATRIADTDAIILDKTKTIKSLIIVITDRQDEEDAEQLHWSEDLAAAGNINAEYEEDTGVLTLTSETKTVTTGTAPNQVTTTQYLATPDDFLAVLRSITYTNAGTEPTDTGGGEGDNNTDDTPVVHGTSRTFEFVLEGGSGEAVGAKTTIYVKPPTINEQTIFVLEKILDPASQPGAPNGLATLTFHIINETGQPYTNVVAQGTLTGNNYIDVAHATYTPNPDIPGFNEVTTKWLDPTGLQGLFDPVRNLQVNWFVGTVAAHSEATLTVKIPLKTNAYGKQVTGLWTAKFGGDTPVDQTIAAQKLE